ncbi:uncharacterized protein LOC142240558 [Haematobia irritans]|uniref:uncharacterized protein LOC142240558 n=1 Tax=Haematobia irritans TaxID=7368 RepID=UPI003F50944A
MELTGFNKKFFAIIILTFVGCECLAGRYQFIYSNEYVYDRCENAPPGAKGIENLVDLSNLHMEYIDGNIQVNGNATCVWKDVLPTDRIEWRVQVYKFIRGTWQPTVLSVYMPNFCDSITDKNSITYQVWAKHIFEEDQKCLNNYGHTYRHHPFEVDMVYEFGTNMEGRYKIVDTFTAYDGYNIQRPNKICFEHIGEFIKVK